MRYFVGVDGGSSRLDAIVADETGRRLGRGHSGPIYGGRGRDHPNARVHLLDAVDEALVNSGVSPAAVSGIFLACANWTAARTPDAVEWLGALEVPAAAITVSDDGDTPAAWAAAGFPDPAIVVTLGTFWGSSGVVDGREVAHLTDRLDLDRDSAALAEGATIGSLALRAAIYSQVAGPPTALYEAVCSALALDGIETLRDWARANDRPEARAWLCSVAAQAAAAGDAEAVRLFRQGGVGLAQATIPMAHWMGCADRPLRVALAGNVWRAGAVLLEPFEAAIKQALPKAEVRLNELTPEEGALLLALRIGHLQVELRD